jgi:hypothetical protein
LAAGTLALALALPDWVCELTRLDVTGRDPDPS